jgi:hypothetical protein
MDQKRSKILATVALLGAVAAAGCHKDEPKPSASAPAAAPGCGSDYADPNKQFCIAVGPDYQPVAPVKEGELVRTSFNAAMSGIDVLVLPKEFDEQVALTDKTMHGSDRKLEESGGTPGKTKWWVYSIGKKKYVEALAKSSNGKAIECSSNNSVVPPAVIDACKTLRPY